MDPDLFVTTDRTLVEDFTCPICLCVVKDPIEHKQCSTLYCQGCVSQLRKNECPSCRGPIFGDRMKSIHPILRDRVYLKMELKCSFEGCSEIITIGGLIKHEQDCPFRQGCTPIVATNNNTIPTSRGSSVFNDYLEVIRQLTPPPANHSDDSSIDDSDTDYGDIIPLDPHTVFDDMALHEIYDDHSYSATAREFADTPPPPMFLPRNLFDHPNSRSNNQAHGVNLSSYALQGQQHEDITSDPSLVPENNPAMSRLADTFEQRSASRETTRNVDSARRILSAPVIHSAVSPHQRPPPNPVARSSNSVSGVNPLSRCPYAQPINAPQWWSGQQRSSSPTSLPTSVNVPSQPSTPSHLSRSGPQSNSRGLSLLPPTYSAPAPDAHTSLPVALPFNAPTSTLAPVSVARVGAQANAPQQPSMNPSPWHPGNPTSHPHVYSPMQMMPQTANNIPMQQTVTPIFGYGTSAPLPCYPTTSGTPTMPQQMIQTAPGNSMYIYPTQYIAHPPLQTSSNYGPAFLAAIPLPPPQPQ